MSEWTGDCDSPKVHVSLFVVVSIIGDYGIVGTVNVKGRGGVKIFEFATLLL